MTGLNFLFNLFWVILVGLLSAICSFFVGLACCLTIIGIPFGLQHFKFIKLVFAPAGKRVFTHFGKHPVMNLLWLIFGGLPLAVLYFLLGTVLCLTVVGAPIGVQLCKIATFNLAPFGAEIVAAGEYTRDKRTLYDYDLLTKRIIANPDTVLAVNAENEASTVRTYLQANELRLEREETDILVSNPKYDTARTAGFAVSLVLGGVIFWLLSKSVMGTVWGVVIGAVAVAALVTVTYSVAEYYYYTKPLMARYAAQYGFLFEYYPAGAPVAKCNVQKYYTVTMQEKVPFSGKVRTVRKSVRKSRISTILENIK